MSSLLSIIYKHFSFSLEKEKFASFLEYLQKYNIVFNLEKDYKGRFVLTFWKEEEKAISFCLEEENEKYIVHQTFETTDLTLEEVIRNSISEFNITTIAEHQFQDNMMIYHYQDGVIHKIVEKTQLSEKVIYEFPSEITFEKRIENIKKDINFLLDKRNDHTNKHDITNIDRQLKILSQKMKKHQNF